jgi:quercetin dioxygenase-like cupin family protein
VAGSVRRFVTSADEVGAVSVISVAELAITPWTGADAGDAVVWSTDEVPVDNSSAELGRPRSSGTTIDGGTMFRVTELGPGFMTPIHRTRSADYCVVLEGQLELVLPGGATVALGPGDTVVQRGADHAWRNPSTDTRCRFVVCMIESQALTIRGKTLRATPQWRLVASVVKSKLGARSKLTPTAAAPRAAAGVRRVVAAFDHTGTVVATEDRVREIRADGPGRVHEIWSSGTVPVDNAERGPRTNDGPPGVASARGSRFDLITLAPGQVFAERVSNSLDYVLVLEGSLEIGGGEAPARLTAGDALVQRGAAPTWRNLNPHSECVVAAFTIEGRRPNDG